MAPTDRQRTVHGPYYRLAKSEQRKVLTYERKHANRKSVARELGKTLA